MLYHYMVIGEYLDEGALGGGFEAGHFAGRYGCSEGSDRVLGLLLGGQGGGCWGTLMADQIFEGLGGRMEWSKGWRAGLESVNRIFEENARMQMGDF